MLKETEILQFIKNDINSKKKRNALIGQRYYEGEHDIKDYKLYYFNADGKIMEDTSRSNIKISHPFFTELVDQEVQYMLSGKDGYVKSNIPALQTELNAYFNDNEDFTSELNEVISGSASKGFEYMYAYKNAEDKTSFQCADSIGVVEVRARDTDDNCDYVIYWYVDRIDKGQKEIKRIQVWDANTTTYYIQVEEGKLELDKNVKVNPRPHIVYQKNGDESLYYEGNGGYGFIPFFRLDNNRKQVSGLKAIKDIIDDYDLMSCGLSNNLQDITEGIYVVKGFAGDEMDELIRNIKTKKAIGVSEDGDVDIRTIDIPYEARKTKLELDEKNIYRFGMGFNSAQLGDGNITNIVIKSRYALLDLKCNKLEIRLKQFLRKILKVVLKEINESNETKYQQKDVYFNFEREVMTNASDNAGIKKTDAETQQILISTILNVASTLDQETVLESICEILDIDCSDVKEKVAPNAAESLNKAKQELNVSASEVKDQAKEQVGKTLNGAQTSSLISVIGQWKAGALSEQQAINIIAISVGISTEEARNLLSIEV